MLKIKKVNYEIKKFSELQRTISQKGGKGVQHLKEQYVMLPGVGGEFRERVGCRRLRKSSKKRTLTKWLGACVHGAEGEISHHLREDAEARRDGQRSHGIRIPPGDRVDGAWVVFRGPLAAFSFKYDKSAGTGERRQLPRRETWGMALLRWNTVRLNDAQPPFIKWSNGQRCTAGTLCCKEKRDILAPGMTMAWPPMVGGKCHAGSVEMTCPFFFKKWNMISSSQCCRLWAMEWPEESADWTQSLPKWSTWINHLFLIIFQLSFSNCS